MQIWKRFGNWEKFGYFEKINWKNGIFGGKWYIMWKFGKKLENPKKIGNF